MVVRELIKQLEDINPDAILEVEVREGRTVDDLTGVYGDKMRGRCILSSRGAGCRKCWKDPVFAAEFLYKVRTGDKEVGCRGSHT